MTAGREKKPEPSAFLVAERDVGFLARPELRPVRLQLEYLKPDLLMREQGIASTIVVFGSARVPAPEDAANQVARAEAALAEKPGDPALRRAAAAARELARHSKWYEEARRFASLVSSCSQRDQDCHYVMITGGGPGIMEAANRGASDVGAKSIGLNIRLPFEQRPNPFVHPSLCFNFHYFAMRKLHFLLRAKALVFFPGGFGTLDEMFEALTLIQTGKVKRMPVVLCCRDYWSRVLDVDFLVDQGMIAPADAELIQYAESGEEAWGLISRFYAA
jgi:uncharacterized protein (TIGR00730 family)